MGSYFQIISFGSGFETMALAGYDDLLFPYNNDTKALALAQIKEFEADYGGTKMYEPIQHAFGLKLTKVQEMRLFLLTDGHVNDPQ